jgi:hypothetical protein
VIEVDEEMSLMSFETGKFEQPWSSELVPHVTAAYAMIMSRLGVVVTRLLAAAFWLGVGNR